MSNRLSSGLKKAKLDIRDQMVKRHDNELENRPIVIGVNRWSQSRHLVSVDRVAIEKSERSEHISQAREIMRLV